MIAQVLRLQLQLDQYRLVAAFACGACATLAGILAVAALCAVLP